MKRPIILQGESFDWEKGQEYATHAVDEEGNVNWGAAMFADPGVMQCPACNAYLWKEGKRVCCPDCGHEWDAYL
jgi:Zn finger protein HypA/HybF involved in hydrogenase expression